MKRTSILACTLAACAFAAMSVLAQEPVPPPAPTGQPRSPVELDQLLGPIALYPDPLLSELLPAATLPPQIVIADRYLQSGGDPNLIDQQPWDDSIKAMARYPSVLKWLDDNLAWTTAVGEAFQYQQPDVMESIQRLRGQAQSLGNLTSTPQENIVTDDDGSIEVLPADPGEIYVPVYQPGVVFFQRPFGAPFISFGAGFAIGAWLHHDFDWHNHNVFVWSHDHPRPADWWSRRPGDHPHVAPGQVGTWRPQTRVTIAARGQDRGWEAPSIRAPAPVVRPERAAPRVEERPAVAPRSHATGALIGGESAQQARQFSSRGQQSRASAPSPASHGGGGGGKRR
jgi:Protein of unknown function (DUF3300)